MMDKQTRRRHWQGILSEQSSSGLSKQDFCAVRGINPATFYYWQRRLRQVKAEASMNGFTQVRLVEEYELSIYCAGSWIALRSSCAATLAEVVKALADA